MKTIRVLLVGAIGLLAAHECLSQPIIWSGAGDGVSWSDAQNWAGQQVPGAANNVFITNFAGGTVIISSDIVVQSVLCSNALTISGGSLTVTAGASLLQGVLSASNGAVLSATGAGTSLTSGGMVDITDTGLTVSGGAVLSLPAATIFQAGCGNVYWRASGTGSVLELPGLTNLTEPTCYDALTIQGLSGGEVILGNVVTIEAANGSVSVQADGSNSLVNLSGLATNLSALSLEASGGGGVDLSSLAVSGNMNLTLNSGGFISTAQFTNIDDASFYVTGGEVLALPGVTAEHPACGSMTWKASGAGSVLDLPGLTNLTEPACYDALTIQALSGGQVILSNAVTIEAANGSVSVQADGSNSLVNLSALATNLSALSLEASGGGTLLMPSFATSGNMSLTLNSGGFISTTQFTNIDDASFYVTGGEVLALPGVTAEHAACGSMTWKASGTGSVLDLPGLTNLTEPTCYDALTIQALSGGQVILSNAVTIEAANGSVSVQADGSNSLVKLSALATNLSALTVEASGGGTLLMPSFATSGNMSLTLNSGGFISVAQFTNIDDASFYVTGGEVLALPGVRSEQAACGNMTWEASGTGSLLELPGLTNLTEPTCFDGLTIRGISGGQVILSSVVSMMAANGTVSVQADGSNSLINLSALATNLAALTFEASGGGSVQASSFASTGNLTLTLNSGGQVSFDQFTNIDGANLYANEGEVLSLPGVVSYRAGCGNIQWVASGPGSIVELPSLITFQEPSCEDNLTIEGLNGGQVILSNATTITANNGDVIVKADGSNSLVNLSALATNFAALNLEASGGGAVMVPSFAVSGNMSLTLNSGGFISTGQFTNIDSASLYANGGAVLSLPLVAAYSAGCSFVDWYATGAGSILELPGLTNLEGANCNYPMNIQAVSGGQVLLALLQNIPSGDVSFLANDAGSTIDLTGLSRLVLQSGQGSLTEQNGGTILFNNQPLLLYNTAINIPGVNPIPPQTLALSATPWHAYRVEEQNTLNPGGPVITFLVAQTNSLQSIAFAPPPNTTFVVTDFIANPPILQIGLTADDNTQLVLFGLTNATYQIQSATNLSRSINWLPGSAAVMTNAFRIFPETSPTGAVQVYRAKQQ